ncbi:hypothetical protein OR1_04158 [Geobacter sp. OR-1]|nr:hypothetical protein OR1_04158 [Geobacter sp. OR-1]
MRPPLKYPADHPAAGPTRPHLQEQPDSIVIGRIDHSGEVDPFDRLAEDRAGGTLSGDIVGSTLGAAVIGDPGRRGDVEKVQVMVWLGDFGGHLAMDRGDTGQGMETAAEHGDHPFDPFGVAADDAFIRGVDDQQVDMSRGPEGVAHLPCGCFHHADAPANLL